MKKSTVEGHGQALQRKENLDAWFLGESCLVQILVGVFRLRGGGVGLHVSLCSRLRR